MTVRELLARCTSAELSEQMAYDLLQRRLDEEVAQVRALDQTVQNGLESIKREVRR